MLDLFKEWGVNQSDSSEDMTDPFIAKALEMLGATPSAGVETGSGGEATQPGASGEVEGPVTEKAAVNVSAGSPTNYPFFTMAISFTLNPVLCFNSQSLFVPPSPVWTCTSDLGQNLDSNPSCPSLTQGLPPFNPSCPSPTQGLPPVLLIDEDDLYWMSHLHNSLYALGFSCGDDEMEDWIFGEGTREAIFAYQASAGLPETGTVPLSGAQCPLPD